MESFGILDEIEEVGVNVLREGGGLWEGIIGYGEVRNAESLGKVI
jgi:hypothetical protein